jgi:glycosyltransferase involved in cell wall biosynthesis
MSTQKILYIANGNSIHDVKWISFFSNQAETFSCYLLCDALCVLSEQTKKELAQKNIEILPQIPPFSITSPLRTYKAIRQFRRMIKEIKPDLVHVLFATPNALWLNFTKIPSIITMRGSDILIVIPDLLRQSGVKSLYFKFLFSMFDKAFRKSKSVTGTSWTQIQEAKSLFNGVKLELIRTGVDVSKISEINQPELIPDILKDKLFVFSPRFMSPIYNIELQIDAISRLGNELLSRYIFVFIRGKQFDQDYYEKQKQKLELLKKEINLNYLVFDYLDQSTMWMFLKKASLCMMTPISDGTPNSALEAMSAKCPLIVSNLNYDKDLFEGTCIKLNTSESTELAETIELALENYANDFIEKGYVQVSALGNRELEMKKLENLYKSSIVV